MQQSLSVLSEAFGFTSSLAARVESSPPIGPREQARPSGSPPLYPYSNGKSSVTKSQGGHKAGLISSLSDPIPHLEINEVLLDDEQTSSRQHFALEDCDVIPEHRQGSCINREIFGLKRREINGTNSSEKGHSSDTEVCSSSISKRPPGSGKAINGRTKEHANLPTSLSVDSFPFNPADDSPDKNSNGCLKNDLDVSNSNSQSGHNSSVQKEVLHCRPPFVTPPHFSGHPMQGQLHAAWNTMQDTFAEVIIE